MRSRSVLVVSLRLLGALVIVAQAGPAATETLGPLTAGLPPFLATNFEELVKTAAASCEILPLEVLFSREYTSELPLLDVVEFTRAGRRSYRVSNAHHRLREHPRPTSLIVYVPGWLNSPDDEASQALVSALLRKNPIVLVLDTRLAFHRGYISSASRVKALANLLYSFIKNVYREGMPLSAVHLIGFSLGAHVAGITGKLVKNGLKEKIGRITALDPAKPCFVRLSDYRLDKNDAQFVQVVHSSAGILGLENPLGHADVYVNGVLVKQPECRDRSITLECDHAQAWRLYSESVQNDRSLMGRECRSWNELMRGECSGNETVVGYSCSASSRGMFLYKSNMARSRRREPRFQVFNPFDPFSWL
ncbi:lipase member H-like [Plodia interpunctella]|uniref:lipase member H-like n=1 Tax=Plodia interpunctella TaxID=58824 RepID=UPI002367C183|nr:lipase member H-like [Plodia interpunctella]